MHPTFPSPPHIKSQIKACLLYSFIHIQFVYAYSTGCTLYCARTRLALTLVCMYRAVCAWELTVRVADWPANVIVLPHWWNALVALLCLCTVRNGFALPVAVLSSMSKPTTRANGTHYSPLNNRQFSANSICFDVDRCVTELYKKPVHQHAKPRDAKSISFRSHNCSLEQLARCRLIWNGPCHNDSCFSNSGK